MSPELRFFIYTTIIGVIVSALAYAAKKIFDLLTKPKQTAIDRGQAITELADAMVDVSKKAIEGVRAELTAARTDLDAARAELVETKKTMERREHDHADMLGHLRRRIAQLAQVLIDNNLDVPPEEAQP